MATGNYSFFGWQNCDLKPDLMDYAAIGLTLLMVSHIYSCVPFSAVATYMCGRSVCHGACHDITFNINFWLRYAISGMTTIQSGRSVLLLIIPVISLIDFVGG